MPVYILFIGLPVLAQLMQIYAFCLLPKLLRYCCCLLFLCRSLLVLQLHHCVGMSIVLGFCCLIYSGQILQCMLGYLVCNVYSGIACLNFLTCDWSQLYARIAYLAFLAYDWLTACWDSLSILLYAGIACLASMAYDWANACQDSLVALGM